MRPVTRGAPDPSAGGLGERLRLIVITDRKLAAPRSVTSVVEAALTAGAPSVQLRDKEATGRELLALGRDLRELTRAAGALFFVNDRLDVALALEADGVHLGPDDIPVSMAREIVPDGFLIGYSTDSPTEARAATREGADYLGCGTVYPTSSKPDAGESIGPGGLQRVVASVSVPVVGIGGIGPTQAPDVAAVGAAGVAVIGAVMQASDPAAQVRRLLTPWE